MVIKDWKRDFFTIPNMLSFFRLGLIPVYVLVYLRASEFIDHIIAASILAVSCLTDMVDGQIARRFHMISTFGKFIDPVADKCTQFTLLVCLAIKYPLLWILASLMVFKEGFQLVAGIIQFRKGKMLTGALITGKICTAILFVSLIIMVLIPRIPAAVVTWITAVNGTLLAISFAHYGYTYFTQSNKIQYLE